MHKRAICWAFLILILVTAGAAMGACRPKEVVVEKPVTREVTKSVETTVVIENPVAIEKTVVVTTLKTVQVVVTLTPTPIPEGGFVTRAILGDAKTLNPLFAADSSSQAICDLLFEGLLTVNPFTGALEPNFAQEWQVSEDGLTYTFAIRQGLRWSDGASITAHDLNFTYQALLSGKLDTPHNKFVSNIRQVHVVDDYTVAITFATPDCANLEKLKLGWLPMHVFTDQIESFDMAELATHEFGSRPTVASGPFVLNEWARGEQITLSRNKQYWRGVPHLEGIVARVVSGQAELVQLLKSQEIDIGADIDPQYLANLESGPTLNILKFLSDEYDFIGFQLGDPNKPLPRLDADGKVNEKHGEHPILSDKRVRQAIVYALDRAEMVNAARVGQGIPLAANVLPTVSWAYNTDLKPREYSLEKAAQLLDQAGWTLNPNTGIRSKNGRPLHLRLHTNAGNAVREAMAQSVQEQLEKVGIEVEVITLPWELFLDVLFGQTFDMVLTSWANLGVNPDDAELWSASADLPSQGNNFISYNNPEVDKSLAQAAQMPACNQDARAEIYRQVQARLYDDQPYCWIDVPRKVVAFNKHIGGVNPGPWSVWYNIHEWYIQE